MTAKLCTTRPTGILLALAGVGLLAPTSWGQTLPPSPSVAGGAEGAPAAVASQLPPASWVLEQAIRTLEARPAFKASLVLQTDLFDKRLVGEGTYSEQREGPIVRFRMEARIQLGDQLSSSIVVCDGDSLWRFQRLRGQGTLTHIDLAQVTRALEEAGQRAPMGRIGEWPAIGGLAKTLRTLQAQFDFVANELTQVPGGTGETASGGNQWPVWKLTGQWTPARLAELLPAQKAAILEGKPVDVSLLAEPLPHYVVLYLGRDDFFPYGLEYWRLPQKDKKGHSDGPPRAVTTIGLFRVDPNPALDRSSFNYNPGNLDQKDRTQEYLRSLKLRP